jgi:hypothetical protein
MSFIETTAFQRLGVGSSFNSFSFRVGVARCVPLYRLSQTRCRAVGPCVTRRQALELQGVCLEVFFTACLVCGTLRVGQSAPHPRPQQGSFPTAV